MRTDEAAYKSLRRAVHKTCSEPLSNPEAIIDWGSVPYDKRKWGKIWHALDNIYSQHNTQKILFPQIKNKKKTWTARQRCLDSISVSTFLSTCPVYKHFSSALSRPLLQVLTAHRPACQYQRYFSRFSSLWHSFKYSLQQQISKR